MQKTDLHIVRDGKVFAGFDFDNLPLPAAQAAVCEQIDAAADAARSAVVGDPLRAIEYERAAAEARAFAAADYKGTVPPTVKSWADASGMTARKAADNIITQADAWDTGLYAIRAARLQAKEKVKAATDHATVEAIAEAAINGIRTGVAAIAG